MALAHGTFGHVTLIHGTFAHVTFARRIFVHVALAHENCCSRDCGARIFSQSLCVGAHRMCVQGSFAHTLKADHRSKGLFPTCYVVACACNICVLLQYVVLNQGSICIMHTMACASLESLLVARILAA